MSSRKSASSPKNPAKPENKPDTTCNDQQRLSRYQRFNIQRIPRAMLKEAPYNPRVMGEHEHKLLNKSLKKSGLVETIVWNKRTGYVVGGHQRLSELDKLEGGKDYSLDVCVIDVSEQEEREINIKLNNSNLMGEYDAEKLAALFIEDGVNFADAGFSALDIQLNFDTPQANAILGTDREEEPEVVSDIEKINEIKERRKTSKERANLKNTAEFFKVIVFDSMESMDEFTKHFGFEVEPRYIDGEELKTKIGIGREAAANEEKEGDN
jgi:hypothetical protein